METADEPTVVIPRLVTARLVLRAHRAGDFDAFAANLADPVATLHLGGVADRRAAWRVLAGAIGVWTLTGAGWWGVARRDTGELVGTVGAFFRETPGAELELGWSVFRPHWGQGYASEAAQAALDCAFARHAAPRAIAHIAADNTASIGVARRIGMTFDAEVDFYGERTGRYAVARPAASLAGGGDPRRAP